MIDPVPDLARFVPLPAPSTSTSILRGPEATSTSSCAAVSSNTLVITGGETDVCVMATMLGAIDWGFRVILVTGH
jgi:hypothetical protein